MSYKLAKGLKWDKYKGYNVIVNKYNWIVLGGKREIPMGTVYCPSDSAVIHTPIIYKGKDGERKFHNQLIKCDQNTFEVLSASNPALVGKYIAVKYTKVLTDKPVDAFYAFDTKAEAERLNAQTSRMARNEIMTLRKQNKFITTDTPVTSNTTVRVTPTTKYPGAYSRYYRPGKGWFQADSAGEPTGDPVDDDYRW